MEDKRIDKEFQRFDADLVVISIVHQGASPLKLRNELRQAVRTHKKKIKRIIESTKRT